MKRSAGFGDESGEQSELYLSGRTPSNAFNLEVTTDVTPVFEDGKSGTRITLTHSLLSQLGALEITVLFDEQGPQPGLVLKIAERSSPLGMIPDLVSAQAIFQGSATNPIVEVVSQRLGFQQSQPHPHREYPRSMPTSTKASGRAPSQPMPKATPTPSPTPIADVRTPKAAQERTPECTPTLPPTRMPRVTPETTRPISTPTPTNPPKPQL